MWTSSRMLPNRFQSPMVNATILKLWRQHKHTQENINHTTTGSTSAVREQNNTGTFNILYFLQILLYHCIIPKHAVLNHVSITLGLQACPTSKGKEVYSTFLFSILIVLFVCLLFCRYQNVINCCSKGKR